MDFVKFSRGALQQKETALAHRFRKRPRVTQSHQKGDTWDQTLLDSPPVARADDVNTAETVTKPKDLEDQVRLLNMTFSSSSGNQFRLVQAKSSDKYGQIYKAIKTPDDASFEVRVYSFDKLDAANKKHAKRNCREWKERRRFVMSCKENGLVFLVLRCPSSKVVEPSSLVELSNTADTTARVQSGRRLSLPDVPRMENSSYLGVLSRPLANIASHQGKQRHDFIFFSYSKPRTLQQKENARKVQQAKRQNKRASRKAVSSTPTSPDDQPPNQQPWQRQIPGEDLFPAAHGWYWASDGGWQRQWVLLDDGTSRMATFWSAAGGYMHKDPPDLESSLSFFTEAEYKYAVALSNLGLDDTTATLLIGGPREEVPCNIDTFQHQLMGPDGRILVDLETKQNTSSIDSLTTHQKVDSSTLLTTYPIIPLQDATGSNEKSPSPDTDSQELAAPAPPKKHVTTIYNASTVSALVKMMLEFFFSPDNLGKDTLLKQQMSSAGFVQVSFLAGLESIRKFTKDLDIIVSCCQQSDILELVDLSQDDRKSYLVRRKSGWKEWVLPKEKRDASVKEVGVAQTCST
ncbi:hypothetical protein BDZ45DRAFT_810965 [Acephala macrosclerotiorum]|nr:hypothetical protein BDZ45DRAFT_810965 [Acephala macrosclerotiorum]